MSLSLHHPYGTVFYNADAIDAVVDMRTVRRCMLTDQLDHEC